MLVGYGALINVLPSWALVVAIFAFFMWLFSLLFTAFTVIRRRFKEPRQ